MIGQLSRRRFVQSVAGSVAGLSLAGPLPEVLARAAASGGNQRGRILVVIQLTGGNDGVNTLVPYGDDAYGANRFALRIPSNELIRLGDYAGMHPSLRPLAGLVEARRLAWVQGVGYPQPNRSHFESMDLWHTAHQLTGQRPTGWLGRAADASTGPGQLPPIHLGGEAQPLALVADRVAATSIRSTSSLQLFGGDRQTIVDLVEQSGRLPRGSNNALLGHIERNLVAAREAARGLASVGSGAGRGVAFPPSRFGDKLRQVADLIAADLPVGIYYVTLDGFDTHANQGPAHASLLEDLAGGLAALMEDVARQGNGDRVLAFAFSEFGRRLRENGSLGTDHGAASVALLAGPGLQDPLLGRYPSLTDLDDGDLRFTVDYRSVYAALLEDWLGLPAEPILGQKFPPLALFGQAGAETGFPRSRQTSDHTLPRGFYESSP